MAMQLHHDTFQYLPVEITGPFEDPRHRRMLYLQLLPFIEGTNVLNAYDFTQGTYSDYNLELLGREEPVMQCPSDESFVHDIGGASFDDGGDRKGNYGINFGYGTYDQIAKNDWRRGPFYGVPLSPEKKEFHRFNDDNSGEEVNYRRITDGLSNTMLQLEMRQLPSVDRTDTDRRARIWTAVPGSYQISTRMSPNNTDSDVTACSDENDLLAPCVRSSSVRDMILSSRSRHPGGVQVSFCDGSARYVNNDIDLAAWRAQSTRSGEDPPLIVNDPNSNGQSGGGGPPDDDEH
ncbi:MAG: DUF1559 domain-containing protein [Pirellulales bacterium]|nr:DUF1559 domain-containing protein [Pirellulales bacterium]